VKRFLNGPGFEIFGHCTQIMIILTVLSFGFAAGFVFSEKIKGLWCFMPLIMPFLVLGLTGLMAILEDRPK